MGPLDRDLQEKYSGFHTCDRKADGYANQKKSSILVDRNQCVWYIESLRQGYITHELLATLQRHPSKRADCVRPFINKRCGY